MLKKILTKLGIHFWKEEYIACDIEEIENDERKFLDGVNELSLKYTQFKNVDHLTPTPNCFLHNRLSNGLNSLLPIFRKIRICKICGKMQEYKESNYGSSSPFSTDFNNHWGDIAPTKSDERNQKLEELLS